MGYLNKRKSNSEMFRWSKGARCRLE